MIVRYRRTMALALLALALLACTPADTATTVSVSGQAVAGPVCPVETQPPDPDCAPRAVEGAEVVAFDAAGDEVGRARTDADGRFALELPPGAYRLIPQPVAGLMGTADLIEIEVVAGERLDALILSYDTGIR
jgi:hypothetical protein